MWGEGLSQLELTDLARWVVRPRLMSIPGVANVAIWGERDRQLQVRVDPDRLAALGIGLDRVVAASREAVGPRAGGFVDGPTQRLPVIHVPLVRTADELARITLPLGAAPGRAKFGFFAAETDLFRAVAEELGLVPKHDGWCRHPLAHLVEAADDICYRVVDLEDGFKLGRLGFEETEALLLKLLPQTPSRYATVGEAPQKVAYLRAKAIGRLIDAAVTAFFDNEDAIMSGNFVSARRRSTAVCARIPAVTRPVASPPVTPIATAISNNAPLMRPRRPRAT